MTILDKVERAAGLFAEASGSWPTRLYLGQCQYWELRDLVEIRGGAKAAKCKDGASRPSICGLIVYPVLEENHLHVSRCEEDLG